jgi:hypothetical protein
MDTLTIEERKNVNRAKNRNAQEKRRRKNGAKPQAQSERRTKPWEALGISESTYRRRKRRDSISSRPSLLSNKSDEVLSSGETAAAVTAPTAQAAKPRQTRKKLDGFRDNVVPLLVRTTKHPPAKVGDIVGYVSPLRSGHYRAQVIAVNDDGTFDLDVDIPYTGTAAMRRFPAGQPFRISWVSSRKIVPLDNVLAFPDSVNWDQLSQVVAA